MILLKPYIANCGWVHDDTWARSETEYEIQGKMGENACSSQNDYGMEEAKEVLFSSHSNSLTFVQ